MYFVYKLYMLCEHYVSTLSVIICISFVYDMGEYYVFILHMYTMYVYYASLPCLYTMYD